MRKFIAVAVLCLSSVNVVADDWVGPFLGGVILGNAFTPRYGYGYGYYVPPAPTVIYNTQHYNYNNYIPHQPYGYGYGYSYPRYRVQNVWDMYCGCYRSITVPNY